MKPSQNSPKTPAVEIDDREPMDRLADELGRFVQAMQKMNARQMAQAQEILATLRQQTERAERGAAPPVPVMVDLSAGRPSRYRVTVTGRDKSGHIATVDIEAMPGVSDVIGRGRGRLQ